MQQERLTFGQLPYSGTAYLYIPCIHKLKKLYYERSRVYDWLCISTEDSGWLKVRFSPLAGKKAIIVNFNSLFGIKGKFIAILATNMIDLRIFYYNNLQAIKRSLLP